MERMTVGTHQRHGSTQASASLLQAQKMVPPNGWTSRAHAIVNVVNKRENYTRAADTRNPAGRVIVIYFFRNKQLLFILVLATDQGNNGVLWGLWPI